MNGLNIYSIIITILLLTIIFYKIYKKFYGVDLDTRIAILKKALEEKAHKVRDQEKLIIKYEDKIREIKNTNADNPDDVFGLVEKRRQQRKQDDKNNKQSNGV